MQRGQASAWRRNAGLYFADEYRRNSCLDVLLSDDWCKLQVGGGTPDAQEPP